MIEFFFDCSSPWTYLGFHNIQPLVRELQVDIRWRPILVGGIFNTINKSVYETRNNPVPSKHAYMLKDLQDWARVSHLKILFPPSVFPVNSVKAMRGCIFLEPRGKLVEFATAVFEAYWGANKDISQDAVLRECCERIGIDAGEFFEGIGQASVKEALKANTDELMKRGGFGSPTIFVNGTDMYFGNDRVSMVRAAVLRRRETATS